MKAAARFRHRHRHGAFARVYGVYGPGSGG